MACRMETPARTAVMIPCHNEAATIAKVVDDFRAQLPDADIYVFDNCSTDETAEIAASRGAKVLFEPRLGKGFVIEGMMDRIEADYYVMADGDDTYPAEKAGELLAPVLSGEADMCVGARLSRRRDGAFRPMHLAGNNLVRRLINLIFHVKLTDILSGYRAFNRKVVERIPIVSSGFEVETELTVHMLYYRLRIVEVQVPYRGRPEGSRSKLNTFRDGFRVLWKLFNLVRAFKPLTFFGSIAIVLLAMGVGAGAVPVGAYVTGRGLSPAALVALAVGLMILSAISAILGILLHAINWRFKELHNIMVRARRRD